MSADGQGLNKNRPISPHVEIYAFPTTAIASIMHRITGVAMTGLFAVGGVAALGGDPVEAMHSFKQAAPALVPVAKFAIVFPLVYHYAASIKVLYQEKQIELLQKGLTDQHAAMILGGSVAVSGALSLI